MTLKNGIYEQVIYQLLANQLDEASDKVSLTEPIDEAEAPRVLAKFITEVVKRGLDAVLDNGGAMAGQIALVNKIVSLIQQETQEQAFRPLQVDFRAKQLLAVADKRNTVHAVDESKEIVRPETSIAISSLFTGAVHEPSLYSEFKKEILSCDRIDMLVSFIKWSGVRLMMQELREFTQRGGILRIITTSYMGATDIKAVEELRQLLNTNIKVSYDTKRTRLHAKTYVFYRNSGFSTAYVGSSNLSNVAISSGLEWNVKVTEQDLPETLQKITATFDSYWNAPEFEPYTEVQMDRLKTALRAEQGKELTTDITFLFDIRPYPYQQEILDKLEAERRVRNHYWNLVVAATGTGKTVISALDYKRFCEANRGKANRLLFVAHREEILKQSISCFRMVLKDANFGSLFVGVHRPDSIDHLFMSIQTFNAKNWVEATSSGFYDYIIVDEFHHAAAPSYRMLLDYYQPKILLGLTATPERMDGLSVTSYFSHRIAAEIRLPEAIDRKLLSPFQYFGVSDTIDLDGLKWSYGGYDRNELSNLYTLSGAEAEKRVDNIIQAILRYVTDMEDVKGLGFCVTIDHAQYMADQFNIKGIRSISLTSQSSTEERNIAKMRLVSGEVRFIFVVDIYNEGVDIPEINTVLFLRPTESLTIFLQQLGRGLRLSENKECLTVLDFIGLAHKRYNFEDKYAALLNNTRHSVQSEIKSGFKSVPKGCYIQLERMAQTYVLDNIRASFSGKSGLITRIETFTEDSGMSLTLSNFLAYYHLDVQSIYSRGLFSRLCVAAGVREDYSEPLEEIVQRAAPRLCSIDSRQFIKFIIHLLDNIHNIDYAKLTPNDAAMLRMFYYTIWQEDVANIESSNIVRNLIALDACPNVKNEIIELMRYNFDHIDFLDEKVDIGFDSPLDLYCTYTRDQLLLGIGFFKPSAVREGVKWLQDKNCDIFMITLNKSEKDYSPTTMYHDYSINEYLFHWQSQSGTAPESPTGQRYQTHGLSDNRVLLFVREFKRDKFGFTAPYTYLGLATYVSHEGGRPMSITYQMDKPIPARYLKKTNKLLVG